MNSVPVQIDSTALAAHYGQLLGLAHPWTVEKVDLDLEAKTIRLDLKHLPGPMACPECQQSCAIYDHGERREWRHLDTMQFRTVLSARLPRVRCPEHGVHTVEAPWAEPRGRFTVMFEAFALLVLSQSRSVQSARHHLRLSWEALHQIMQRGVERGLARRDLSGVRQVGIDEKSFLRGQSYVTLVNDPAQRQVLEVTPGRDQQAAILGLEVLPARVRAQIEAVTLDMSPPYLAAVRQVLPEADIVLDRYHVSALLNKVVESVRRAEHRELGGSRGGSVLTGSRYYWVQAPENMEVEQLQRLETLSRLHLRTARAWRHKENFTPFWTMPSVEKGREFFEWWYRAAMRSRLEPLKKAARTLKGHLEGLLGYLEHQITNAMAEALNGLVQTLKTTARGFRNFQNYRTRILFHLGRLDMAPR